MFRKHNLFRKTITVQFGLFDCNLYFSACYEIWSVEFLRKVKVTVSLTVSNSTIEVKHQCDKVHGRYE